MTSLRRPLRVAAASLVLGAGVLLWPVPWGGQSTVLVTRGVSMRPGISAGDLVVLRRTERPRPGQVLGYAPLHGGPVTVHRLVAVHGDLLTFKGDSNTTTDPEPVPRSRLVGRVVLHVAGVGNLLAWALQPLNLVLLLVGIATWLADRSRTQMSPAPPRSMGVRAWPVLPVGLPQVHLEREQDLEQLGGPVLVEPGGRRRLVLRPEAAYWTGTAPLSRPALIDLVPAPRRRQTVGGGREWAYAGSGDGQLKDR